MHLGCKTFKKTPKILSQKFGLVFFSKVIKQVYHTPMTRNLLGIHHSLLPYPRLPALGAVRRQRWSLSEGTVPAKKLQPGADRWWPIRKLSQHLSHHGRAWAPHNSSLSLTLSSFQLVNMFTCIRLVLPALGTDTELSWVYHSRGTGLAGTHHSPSES